MENLEESNKSSADLELKNATTNNGNEAVVHPAKTIEDDESIQLDSNKNLIPFTSTSSSISSNFSVEDLQILESDHDESSSVLEPDDHLANQNEDSSDSGYITSNVLASKILTGPGNWSMASNESLFSIRMGSTSFCHLDSFSPVMEKEEEDEGNQISATSRSSSSDSFVFPM